MGRKKEQKQLLEFFLLDSDQLEARYPRAAFNFYIQKPTIWVWGEDNMSRKI